MTTAPRPISTGTAAHPDGKCDCITRRRESEARLLAIHAARKAAEREAQATAMIETDEQRHERLTTWALRDMEGTERDLAAMNRRHWRKTKRASFRAWRAAKREERRNRPQRVEDARYAALAAEAKAHRRQTATDPAPVRPAHRTANRKGRRLTTRQAAVLQLAETPAPVDSSGPQLGTDEDTGEVFRYDAFLMNGAALPSANMVVVGEPGEGKSTCVKVHGTRQVDHNRQIAVIAPKDQHGHSEWYNIGIRRGWPQVRFGLGGTVVINPMDRIITRATSHDSTNAAGIDQRTVVGSIVTSELGREMQQQEKYALRQAIAKANRSADNEWNRRTLHHAYETDATNVRAALRLLADSDKGTTVIDGGALRKIIANTHSARKAKAEAIINLASTDLMSEFLIPWRQETTRPADPVMSDVMACLLDPDDDVATKVGMTRSQLIEAGRDSAFAIDNLLDSEIGHVINGQTTIDRDLADAPGIIFDVSQLDKNSNLLPIVMALVGAYLSNAWLRPDGRKRLLVVEEGWRVIANLGTALILERLCKLHRALGLSVISVLHHMGDLDEGDAAVTKAAQSLVKESATIVMYRQKKSQMKALAETLKLSEDLQARVMNLQRGEAIWLINGKPRRIRIIPSWREEPDVFTSDDIAEAPVTHDEWYAGATTITDAPSWKAA